MPANSLHTAWTRCLVACLPPPDARFYEGMSSDDEDGAIAVVTSRRSVDAVAAVSALASALAGTDGRALVEAAEALRDLAASCRNQWAIALNGGWGAAERAGDLVNDEADAAQRAEIRLCGGIPLLLEALQGLSHSSRSPSSSLAMDQESAAALAGQALRYLAFSAANQAAIIQADGVETLVAALRGGGLCNHGPRINSQAGAWSRELEPRTSPELQAPTPDSPSVGRRDLAPRPRSRGGRSPDSASSSSSSEVASGAAAELLSSHDAAREAAAACLANVAATAAGRAAISRGGGIAPLVALCAGADAGGRRAAAAALWSLARTPELKLAIANAGGLEALVALVGDATAPLGARLHAARGLANLAADPDVAAAVAAAGGVAALVRLAAYTEERSRAPGSSAGPQQQGRYDDSEAREAKEAVGAALANLSLHGATQAIAAAGGIAALLAIASSSADAGSSGGGGGLEQARVEPGASGGASASADDGGGSWVAEEAAATALARLGLDPEARRSLGGAAAVHALAAVCATGSSRARLAAAAALTNLCVEPLHAAALLSARGLPPLVRMVARPTAPQVTSGRRYAGREAAARALRNVAAAGDAFRSAIALAGGVPALVSLAASPVDSAREAAAAALNTCDIYIYIYIYIYIDI